MKQPAHLSDGGAVAEQLAARLYHARKNRREKIAARQNLMTFIGSGTGWVRDKDTNRLIQTGAAGTNAFATVARRAMTNGAQVRITGIAIGLAASASTLSFFVGDTNPQGSITVDGKFTLTATIGTTDESLVVRIANGGAGTKQIKNLRIVAI